jgi:hypothetical protein
MLQIKQIFSQYKILNNCFEKNDKYFYIISSFIIFRLGMHRNQINTAIIILLPQLDLFLYEYF